MQLSIRWRLTLWYGGILALILAAFGFVVYAMMDRHLLRRADRALFDEMVEVEDEIHQAPNLASLRQQLDRRFGRDASNEYQVSSLRDGVLFRSQRLGSTELPRPDLERKGADGHATSTTLGGSGHWRIASRVIPWQQDRLLAQVAASLSQDESELNALLGILLIASPLALLGALAGGYLLARKALAPVGRMTASAAEITAQRLDRRLAVGHRRDELGRLAHTLNDMIERLERSFDETQRFTADAAHELRTPLAIIRSEVEVALADPATPANCQKALENVLEETERLTRLADQLLYLCCEDAGLQEAPREKVRFDELARDVTEHMQLVAQEKGVSLAVEDLAPAVVAGDADRMRRLLLNILDNAIKYTPAGGTIAVKVARSGANLKISVTDTGIGIPAEHLPRIFDRFYRVDPSRAGDGSSNGLGLAICRAIVLLHGGQIEVQSAVGEGTSIVIFLPLAYEVPAQLEHEAAPHS